MNLRSSLINTGVQNVGMMVPQYLMMKSMNSALPDMDATYVNVLASLMLTYSQ